MARLKPPRPRRAAGRRLAAAAVAPATEGGKAGHDARGRGIQSICVVAGDRVRHDVVGPTSANDDAEHHARTLVRSSCAPGGPRQ